MDVEAHTYLHPVGIICQTTDFIRNYFLQLTRFLLRM